MKNLITEYSTSKEDKNISNINNTRKFLLKNIDSSESNHYRVKTQGLNYFFLDHAFRQNKNLITKVKNKVNLNNYCYELEKTLSLNLEILLSYLDDSKNKNNKKIIITYDNKSRDTSDTNSAVSPFIIIKLIKSIKEKLAKKAEMNKNKNELVKRINDKIYINKNFYLKVKKEKNDFRQKLHQINKTLDSKDNYLIKMNNKFFNFQKHIDIIKGKKNYKNIYDIIFTNINYKNKIKKVKKSMEKFYCEISDLKTDNELLKEEIELRKDESNKNLIRCMEFYRRSNLKLYYVIKTLKISFRRIVKIMDLLNLGYIVKFSKEKQEDEGNYEIEFSKINKDENNIDLLSKLNKNSNFNDSFLFPK
jgi:hypothetical protein